MSVNYDISSGWQVLLAILIIWELAWKATAMWRAAKRNELGWYIALLVVNSAGILPIIYLLMSREQPKNYKEFSHETAVSV